MNKLLLCLAIMASFWKIQGQESHFMCGHDLMMDFMEAEYPGYRQRVDESFAYALKHQDDAGARTELLKIPVVVHIVWKNSSENLHDSIIYSQIDQLNAAYRLNNTNKNDIRQEFKHLQADANIEFELVAIKRVKTNSNFSVSLTNLPDEVKRAESGGSSAVDPIKHLNIWVCKIQPIAFIGGQILGYAYPPSGLSNWPDGSTAPSTNLEGVVIDYRVFGAHNPNVLTVGGMTYHAIGNTTVHEVGHYLGLRHIWGDGTSIFGGNSCNVDDGIADTPNQGSQTAGTCNKSQNTCIDSSNDHPDMIENYMDYSSESCQNTFTIGQVGLMRSVLKLQRKLLAISTINEANVESNISIFPNPTSDFVNILLNTYEHGRVNIRDIYGKVIYSNVIEGNTTIETSAWTPGVYLVEVLSNGRSFRSKLLKDSGL